MAWEKIDRFLDMMDLKNHTERLYSSLNWEEHIKWIERKISKGI